MQDTMQPWWQRSKGRLEDRMPGASMGIIKARPVRHPGSPGRVMVRLKVTARS